MKPIAAEIGELRALPVSDLVARYEAVFGKPPRIKHRDWLWRKIAWKIQEQRFGGLKETARRKLDELIAELDLPLQRERRVVGRIGSGPRIGTTVSRIWKDREIVATRVEGGWEHDGVVYRSLSGVVRALTGSHWSGPAFFGLNGKGRGR